MGAESIHGAMCKPGDLVATPTGRMARVVEVTVDGRRQLEYLDNDGGEVVLRPSLLSLVHSAPVRGFLGVRRGDR
jgi:hypothetical protein